MKTMITGQLHCLIYSLLFLSGQKNDEYPTVLCFGLWSWKWRSGHHPSKKKNTQTKENIILLLFLPLWMVTWHKQGIHDAFSDRLGLKIFVVRRKREPTHINCLIFKNITLTNYLIFTELTLTNCLTFMEANCLMFKLVHMQSGKLTPWPVHHCLHGVIKRTATLKLMLLYMYEVKVWYRKAFLLKYSVYNSHNDNLNAVHKLHSTYKDQNVWIWESIMPYIFDCAWVTWWP